MKITSNFVDYYDFIQDLTGDSNLEFHRKTEPCKASSIYRIKEKITQERLKTVKMFSDKKENWSMSFFIIGFCDKFHRGVLMTFPDGTEVSYTLTGAVYIPSKYGIELPQEIQDNAVMHFSYNDKHCLDICQEINCPSFVILPNDYQTISVLKNPRLSDYQFEKTKNPYKVYHQTKMFLSSESTDKKQKSDFLISVLKINPFISPFLYATD